MKLIPNWRQELNKAWSIRAAIFTMLLGVADQIFGVFGDRLPPATYSLLALVIAVVKLIDQTKNADTSATP